MDKNENVLEIVNLTKKYNLFTLKNVNFTLKKGEVAGFIGINGAGKTTTIKSIAGLVIPDNGEIKVFGEKLSVKNESKVRDRMGFLLDGDYFFPDFTVKQMHNIISKTYTNWDESTFNELLSKFNLPVNQKIQKFSRGMKVKFSLALALSHHAEILILDEPTSGLDPLVREELIDIFKKLSSKGTSILFSSHITSDLDNIADKIILINDGKIILQEKIEDLRNFYFVVTGENKILTQIDESLFLKIKREKNKFKAVYFGDKQKILNNFRDCIIESAKIEDIMLANIT